LVRGLTVPSVDDTGRKRAGSALNTAQKVTIVFPPGDLITSVLFEKREEHTYQTPVGPFMFNASNKFGRSRNPW